MDRPQVRLIVLAWLCLVAPALGDTTSRSCLTPATRAILERGEAHFGVRFELASTCRPGARMPSGQPSYHRYGMAADVKVPAKLNKLEVARWFYAHAPGLTKIYPWGVHFDTGRWHKLVGERRRAGGPQLARGPPADAHGAR